MILPPHILRMLERLRATVTEHEATERLTSRAATPPNSLRPVREATPESVESLWHRLDEGGGLAQARETLADAEALSHASLYSANIENFIGTVKVPVGVIGPVRVNGLHAHGDYFIPLATTEAAMVASYDSCSTVSCNQACSWTGSHAASTRCRPRRKRQRATASS
jgi:hydroxymethylglutaryl-CoA reductase (NADPH)